MERRRCPTVPDFLLRNICTAMRTTRLFSIFMRAVPLTVDFIILLAGCPSRVRPLSRRIHKSNLTWVHSERTIYTSDLFCLISRLFFYGSYNRINSYCNNTSKNKKLDVILSNWWVLKYLKKMKNMFKIMMINLTLSSWNSKIMKNQLAIIKI